MYFKNNSNKWKCFAAIKSPSPYSSKTLEEREINQSELFHHHQMLMSFISSQSCVKASSSKRCSKCCKMSKILPMFSKVKSWRLMRPCHVTLHDLHWKLSSCLLSGHESPRVSGLTGAFQNSKKQHPQIQCVPNKHSTHSFNEHFGSAGGTISCVDI